MPIGREPPGFENRGMESPSSPYMRGVPSLPDKLLARLDSKGLSTADREDLARRLVDLKRTIRVRRTKFERRTGQTVYVEPPTIDEECDNERAG
jgi:hypothetical protein